MAAGYGIASTWTRHRDFSARQSPSNPDSMASVILAAHNTAWDLAVWKGSLATPIAVPTGRFFQVTGPVAKWANHGDEHGKQGKRPFVLETANDIFQGDTLGKSIIARYLTPHQKWSKRVHVKSVTCTVGVWFAVERGENRGFPYT
jgi:hypothetical protein